MVTYTEFVQLGHEVYKQKGGTYRDGTAADLVQTFAEYWSQNKTELKEMNRAEARQVFERNLSV